MIIGLTGTICAGKGEAARYIVKKGFEYYSFSDFIRNELKKKGIKETRENLQVMGNELRKKDEGFIADALLNKAKSNKIALDGIRHPGEVKRLRKEKDFILIAVDAPQKIRFKRLLSRKRKGDLKTFEEFKKIDDAENLGSNYGQEIDKCIEMADYKIINKNTLKELYKKIDSILYHY